MAWRGFVILSIVSCDDKVQTTVNGGVDSPPILLSSCIYASMCNGIQIATITITSLYCTITALLSASNHLDYDDVFLTSVNDAG